jgi:hypothetical protein
VRAARKAGFNKSKAVAHGKGELTEGVRPSFGNGNGISSFNQPTSQENAEIKGHFLLLFGLFVTDSFRIDSVVELRFLTTQPMPDENLLLKLPMQGGQHRGLTDKQVSLFRVGP